MMLPGCDYRLRPIAPHDGDFLRAMLYEAIYTPPGAPRPDPSIVELPAVRKYVEGWGRADDSGVIAVAMGSGQPLGAAWLRCLTREDPGYGYLADDIPELTMAVDTLFRGRGIGAELLAALCAGATPRHRAISLSVDPLNPAMRLYERFGFVVVGACGASLTMRRDLHP